LIWRPQQARGREKIPGYALLSRESDRVLVSTPRWHQVFANPGKGGPSSDEGEMWQWKKENA